MTWYEVTKPPAKITLNIAEDTAIPFVLLKAEGNEVAEIIVIKEQETYTAYIKKSDGFNFYSPLLYWNETLIKAVKNKIDKRKRAKKTLN